VDLFSGAQGPRPASVAAAGRHPTRLRRGAGRSTDHSHFRHPQVLVLESAGLRVEFVGLRLKSKLVNQGERLWNAGGEDQERLDDVPLYVRGSGLSLFQMSRAIRQESPDSRWYTVTYLPLSCMSEPAALGCRLMV
jgi:hypothetical protein